MSDYLLSVIVPTKNRAQYTRECVGAIVRLDEAAVEVIVQDNSDDPADLRAVVSELGSPHVKLFHSYDILSQTANSELALAKATGRYVTYVGDDDCITSSLVRFVEQMDESDVECALFPGAVFFWPDVVFKGRRYPDLSLPAIEDSVREIDPADELTRCLRRGAQALGDLPRVYHGVVRRDTAEASRERCGAYFPGPSPDMANAVATALVSRTLVRVPLPLFVDGICYHSAAGRGARGDHKAELAEVAQLPAGVEEDWEPRVPKVWLGTTIWAASCVAALKAGGSGDRVSDITWPRLYASIVLFHPDCRERVRDALGTRRVDLLKTLLWVVIGFIERVLNYSRNVARVRMGITNRIDSACPSLESAVSVTDRYCEDWVQRNGGWSTILRSLDSTEARR